MIKLSDLFSTLEEMLSQSWGYIWGTSGQKWTQQNQNNTKDLMAKKYGSKWIGHHVADCSGVMVYIWKKYGLDIHHGSNSIARMHVGKIYTVPHPGYAAFKWKEEDIDKFDDGKGDFYHIGIVSADGKFVYESRSTMDGFTTSPITRWKYFAPFRDVVYNEGDDDAVIENTYGTVISDGRLNVRPEPTRTKGWIIRLDPGEEVQILEYNDTKKWMKIRPKAGGKEGWVMSKFIRVDTNPEPDIPTPEKPDSISIIIPCASEAEATLLLKLFQSARIAGTVGDGNDA